MLAKRIIPCLDVKNARVVKGVRFANLTDAGNPVTLAKFYNDEGADELVFLDITASYEKRNTMLDVVQKVSKEVFIPFTVGGGITSIYDMRKTLLAGADKIAINTTAVKNPQLITKAANIFGSQCIVIAIDTKKTNGKWEVYINGGKTPTGKDVILWAKKVASFGAGEILLTCIDTDGTKQGFNVELTRRVSQAVSVPVIASGGAGKLEDFVEIFKKGKADGALAASLFHFAKLTIKEVKDYLQKNAVSVRN